MTPGGGGSSSSPWFFYDRPVSPRGGGGGTSPNFESSSAPKSNGWGFYDKPKEKSKSESNSEAKPGPSPAPKPSGGGFYDKPKSKPNSEMKPQPSMEPRPKSSAESQPSTGWASTKPKPKPQVESKPTPGWVSGKPKSETKPEVMPHPSGKMTPRTETEHPTFTSPQRVVRTGWTVLTSPTRSVFDKAGVRRQVFVTSQVDRTVMRPRNPFTRMATREFNDRDFRFFRDRHERNEPFLIGGRINRDWCRDLDRDRDRDYYHDYFLFASLFFYPYYLGYCDYYTDYFYPYYYGAPYVVAPITVVLDRWPEYVHPNYGYSGDEYGKYRYITDYPGPLGDALRDIQLAWMEQNLSRLQAHLDRDRKVRIYDGTSYTHSLAASEFLDLTGDAFSQTQTDYLRFTNIDRNGDTARADGIHRFWDQNNDEHVVYVRFVLHRESNDDNDVWLITQVWQSSEPF